MQEVMLSEKQSEKVALFGAKGVEIELDLKTEITHAKAPGLRMIRRGSVQETATTEQSVDAEKAVPTTQHTRMSSSCTKVLSSSLKSLVLAQKGVQLIGSTRSETTNLVTAGGPPSSSRRQTDSIGVIGSK